MSEHCHHDHDDSCCHHDHHCHEEEASCCSHDHHCHHHHHHESFSEQLIHIADEAWMEVLKEKMKAQIVAQSGKHLDELAKLVTEENENRWHDKTKNTNNVHEFRDKISAFFKK